MSKPGFIPPSTRGTSVIDLLAAYRKLVGADVVAAALASLPSETRRMFMEISPLSWVPVDELGKLVDAVGERANRDPERLLDDAVREARPCDKCSCA